MNYKSFLFLVAGVIGMFLLGSCDDGDEAPAPATVYPHSNLVIDITVLVPIHPTSFKYFDYVFHYTDNQGVVQKDTIEESFGGIVVEDWSYFDILDKSSLCPSRAPLDSNELLIKTFTYSNKMPIMCTTVVEMVPKKNCTEITEPFIFYIPKPYIFPDIHFSNPSHIEETPNHTLEAIGDIKIDPMDVKTFQTTYGSMFTSCLSIYVYGEAGYQINYY